MRSVCRSIRLTPKIFCANTSLARLASGNEDSIVPRNVAFSCNAGESVSFASASIPSALA